MDADAVEIRVLGCLIEKQRTTPDTYPLSLNSLRLACNQSTNRDPVVEYDESVIRTALERLSRRGWVRLASGAGSRAAKYRQLFDEALGISEAELAVLAVLMLRGPQTTGELKQRTDRLHPFASLEDVEGVLERLIERGFAVHLDRRPGQKEARYAHLLGGAEPDAGSSVLAAASVPANEHRRGRSNRGPRTTYLEDRGESRVAHALARRALRRLSGLWDSRLERGRERIAHRLELDAVEHVLEEPPDDHALGFGTREPA